MIGFACNETEGVDAFPSLGPQAVQAVGLVRKEKVLPFLRPDGKSQVTVVRLRQAQEG